MILDEPVRAGEPETGRRNTVPFLFGFFREPRLERGSPIELGDW